MKINTLIKTVVCCVTITTSASAATILATDFTGLTLTNGTGVATFTGWGENNGITTPTTSLTFVDGDSPSTVGFHQVTAGEIDVNNNMTAGGWNTSFDLSLTGGSEIDLTNIVIDLRLTNGSGADNSTASKSGQMIFVLSGSVSGVIGTADLGGNTGYPSVNYQRTIDLTSFDNLDTSETYTVTLQARGTGFGHHKSLQGFTLNGDISTIPEPSSTALLGLGGLALLLRRRK